MAKVLVGRQWGAVVALLWGACLAVGAVTPAAAASEQAPGAGTLVFTGEGEQRATRLDSKVSIDVNGMVARVEVSQRFRNTGEAWREGRYLFPLPEDAAVDRLRVEIGDRLIEGEIQEKAEAKATYEQAKDSGKQASLVSQERPNLFTTSVANIGPGQTITVHIRYRERLSYQDGRFSLRFPMTLTPRFTDGPHKGRRGEDTDAVTPPMATDDARATNPVDLGVDLNAGLALAEVSSPSHTIDSEREAAGRYRVQPRSGTVPSDRDFVLRWRPEPREAPSAQVFSETIDGERYTQVMVMPPASERSETLPREVIFVIDTSGSMQGASIRQARRALAAAISRLRPRDRFNVIAYDNDARRWYREPVRATAEQRRRTKRRIEGLGAGGGTRIDRALRKTLDGGDADRLLRQAVVITDGAVSNEAKLLEQIRRNLGGTRLFTVGIGSAPNSYFMSEAAEAGRGTTTTIGNQGDIAARMGELFRKLEGAVARDVTIDWPAGTSAYPEAIPDLYAGEPLVVAAKLPADALRVRVRARMPTGDWERGLDLAEGETAEGVSVLWARARVEALMDRLQQGATEAEVRPKVVATAKRHRLVTRYTSLVAVAKERVRPDEADLDSERVRNNMPAGNEMASSEMPQTATPATRSLLVGGAMLALALGLVLATCRGRRRPCAG
jgi:Ca-activated chloride channel family protein